MNWLFLHSTFGFFFIFYYDFVFLPFSFLVQLIEL